MGLILSVIVLLFSLFSLIGYSSRRSNSKQALQHIKEAGTCARQLTAEEIALLEPSLFNPQNAKPIALNNHDVFKISGEYARHGLESNGSTTWHDTIADIEVILPYDAELFLDQFNEAEIVIADRFSIVVSLNGSFDLAGGQVRNERRAQEDLYWQSGKRETFQNSDPTDVQSEAVEQQLTPEDAEIAAEIKRISHAEVIKQRSETTNEIIQRTPLSLGFGIATLFIMSFALLAIAINLDSLTFSIVLTATAGLFVVWALLLLIKRPTLPPAGKVNTVRGHLNHLNSDGLNHYLLGSKIAVVFPPHWIKFVEADKDVEMDLRTDDYSPVRMGSVLSIDDEINNHPPVYWGRYLTLALVGFIALLATLFFTNSLRSDMLFSWSWLTAQQPTAIRSTDALKQQFPITSGSRLEILGSARCEIDTSRISMPIDCLQIRWDGQIPSAPDRQLDPQTLSISSGKLMRLTANPALDKMLEMQRRLNNSSGYGSYGSGYGNYGYGREPAIVTTTFSDISAMVNELDSYCEQFQRDRSNGDVVTNNCNSFRSQFIRLLDDFSDEISVKNWAELKELVENGTLQANQVIALEKDTASLFEHSDRITRPVLTEFSNALAKDIAATQRGGAIIKIAQGSYSSMPTDMAFDRANTLRKMELYRYLASERSAFDIAIIGTVISSYTDASGTPVLVVDTSYNYDQPLPPELQLSILVLLSLWLSVWYGLRTIIGVVKAERRISAIDKDYAKRLGKW